MKPKASKVAMNVEKEMNASAKRFAKEKFLSRL